MKTHDEKWFIGYTAPRHEKKIEWGIQDRNVEVFLPMKVVEKQWSDRVKKSEVPLFPNYIFVKIALRNLIPLLEINGLIRFISFNKEYATISEAEINSIKTIVKQSPETVCIEDDFFRKGMKVKVTNGPFKGFEGELYKRGGKSRFIIRINAINQNISFEISRHWVQPLAGSR